MVGEVEVDRHPKFYDLYEPPPGTDTIVIIGGRGGAKTYEVSKFTAFTTTIQKKRALVMRDEKELVRESILNEILLRYDSANEYGCLDVEFDRLDTGIKNKKTKEMVVFTKGFRATDLKKTANLKGASNIDIVIIEEAEDIRDVTKFNTFADSIRKEGAIIVIILNTPDINHWIVKRYFNTIHYEGVDHTGKELTGYYALIPKEIPGFVCIQTSFEDNSHLPQHIITKYNGYGDPNSIYYDLHYYLTAIRGLASSGRRGQIHKKIKPISLKEYLALPFKEMYGQDFGTASPAGMVGVKLDKNRCYCRQLNYEPKDTLELAKMYCTLKIPKTVRIVADAADKNARDQLRSGYKPAALAIEEFVKYPELRTGWNVIPCIKGDDSLDYGIQLMNSMQLYAVEESKELWEEIRNRVHSVDQYGNFTNKPAPGWDHLIDPWMYCIVDQRGRRSMQIMEEPR